MSKTIQIIKTTLDTGDEVNDAVDGLNGLMKMLEKNHTKCSEKDKLNYQQKFIDTEGKKIMPEINKLNLQIKRVYEIPGKSNKDLDYSCQFLRF